MGPHDSSWGVPDLLDSDLPIVPRAALGSTCWAPAWTGVLGAVGGLLDP